MNKLFSFHFFSELITSVFWSCWAAALIDTGFSVSNLALILSAFLISQAIFEVPTGYFADKHSRKSATVLGLFTISLGYLICGLSHSVIYLITGFFI